MKQGLKWAAGSVLAVGLLLGTGLLVLHFWIASADFRIRAQAQAAQALGVPVELGRIEVDPWPVPAVALEQVRVRTQALLQAERVEVRPLLRALLWGRLELATVLVRRADLPQAGIDELLASLRKKQKPEDGQRQAASQGSLPHRIVLDAVTWHSTGGEVVSVDGDARLGPDGLPETAAVKVVAGQLQGLQAQLKRRDSLWDVKLDHAGGTVQGTVEWQPAPAAGKDMVVTGMLETRNLELSMLRRGAPGPLSGRLEASTSFSGRAAHAGAVLDGLQTRSRFTVRNAVLRGMDLAKAVRTVGLSRGGETRLDTLSGQVDTRGQSVQLSNLAASSGVLSASGNVAVSPRRALNGRIQVSLGAAVVGEAVGVPLVVGGTLDAPEVTLTRAALLGAAIGTTVLPGVGTSAGAQLGDKLGEKIKGLFGK